MKRFLSTVLIMIILSTGLARFTSSNAISTNNTEQLSTIIMTLLMPEIQNAVDEFYAPYLTIQPTVVAFLGSKIIGIKGGNCSSHYTITVEVMPYIGPHLSVGKDRLTLYISPLGIVTVKSFEHLESGILPWNYQNSIIKPLP